MESNGTTFARNWRLVIEYDGGAFHGWQKQRGLLTVQGELERVVHTVLRTNETSGLQAAGRTDAGVHARAQVVNFRTDAQIDPLLFKHSVSSLLKGKLSVLDVCEVPLEFNSLHSAQSREYEYHILNRPAPAVLDYSRVWHVASPIDVERMQCDAALLVGQHDFTSFRAAGCMSSSAVKTIFESEVMREGELLIYRVRGKGFLKQMVRNIAGTLVQLARGKLDGQMDEILGARDRRRAGVTAPGHALYLNYIQYEGWRSDRFWAPNR